MRILVVDDQEHMREALRLIFETTGHEVWEAANGKIALDQQKTTPADLVVTDILMPGMEGIELITHLRKIAPPVKIIAISGGGRVDPNLCLTMARELGADRILLKPFSKSTIVSMVSELFPDNELDIK